MAVAACSASSDDAETANAAMTVAAMFPDEQRWLTLDAPPFTSITSNVPRGGTVEVVLDADEYRGLAYSLQPSTPEGRFGSVEWMVLAGVESEGLVVAIEDFTEVELLTVSGPRTDRFEIPDEMTPGIWQLCIAFTSEPRCSEFTVLR